MYRIGKSDIGELEKLIGRHNSVLTAPRDDYWEDGYLSGCTYYRIADGERALGFFSIDQENAMTQIYLDRNQSAYPEDVFDFVLKEMGIAAAYIESCDTDYLLLATEKAKTVDVFIRIYTECGCQAPLAGKRDIGIRLAVSGDLEDIVAFQVDSLEDADAEWLREYCAKWIRQRGIYLFVRRDEMIGIGELRTGHKAGNVAFLGVIVGKKYRRQGWGQFILVYLKRKANEMGLAAICSTDSENIASDRTIRKSGFFPAHRIYKATF